VAEERRLLYVGLTRARRYLYLTASAEKKPSQFLAELGDAGPPRRERRADAAPSHDDPALAALKAWRRERARVDGVPAYIVFDNRTLAAIVARNPQSLPELAEVSGIGPAKLERYGGEVLHTLARL
jgi:DNA helicase-2/ATP-dependent DNA helicase PcrA